MLSLEDYLLMREVIAAIREARSRPIAARCSISACAGGAARRFEQYRYVERKMTEAGVLHPQSYQQALWSFLF